MDEGFDYLFVIDSLAMLNNDALKNLMVIKRCVSTENFAIFQCMTPLFRNVIAPLLVRPEKLFSNFWGAIAGNGFYARADDYQLIVENQRR